MNKAELRNRLDELKKEVDKVEEESFNHPNGWQWYCNHPILKEYEKVNAQLRRIDDYKLEDIPDYGDHMTMEEFIQSCRYHMFTDDDGFGKYATKDKVSNICIYPSDIAMGIYRNDFTHVVWYNK